MKKPYSFLLVGGVLLLLIVWFGFTNLQGSSNTVIGAINKGMNGVSFGPVNYIVKELPINGGKVVFYIRNINDNQIVFDIRYVKKTLYGWKVTSYGGEMGGSSISYHPSARAIKGMPILQMYLPKSNGVNLDPMIVGTIADTNIREVVIKYKSGLEKQANMIKVNDAFKIFYQFVNGKNGNSYNIITYHSEGTVLKQKKMNITAQSSSVTNRVSN